MKNVEQFSENIVNALLTLRGKIAYKSITNVKSFYVLQNIMLELGENSSKLEEAYKNPDQLRQLVDLAIKKSFFSIAYIGLLIPEGYKIVKSTDSVKKLGELEELVNEVIDLEYNVTNSLLKMVVKKGIKSATKDENIIETIKKLYPTSESYKKARQHSLDSINKLINGLKSLCDLELNKDSKYGQLFMTYLESIRRINLSRDFEEGIIDQELKFIYDN